MSSGNAARSIDSMTVNEMIDQLDKQIEELAAVAEQLTINIEPILAPTPSGDSPQAPISTGPAPDNPFLPLRLSARIERLGRISHRLRGTADRVRL